MVPAPWQGWSRAGAEGRSQTPGGSPADPGGGARLWRIQGAWTGGAGAGTVGAGPEATCNGI